MTSHVVKLDNIRIPTDDVDERRNLREARRAHNLSGRIIAYNRHKQRVADAQREKERAELARVEEVNDGMSGLDLAEVDGEEMEVAARDERSLSWE